MTTPEINKQGEAPRESPTDVREPEPLVETPAVEETAVSHTPGQVAAQIGDDTSQQAPPTVPDDQVPTITVPASPQQLDDWAKGPPENSLTWLAFYWIRMIKKALLHGFRVVAQPPQLQNA